jgi:hypothetical protein
MAARHRKIDSSWEERPIQRDQPQTCPVSGKRMYANEGEAKATAIRRMSDKESAPTLLRTYKCLYCGAWHLTSKER